MIVLLILRGVGEYRRPYNKILETAVGDIWLWHHQSGCRKIVCKDGIHSSVSFTKENGKLSTNAVNSFMRMNRE